MTDKRNSQDSKSNSQGKPEQPSVRAEKKDDSSKKGLSDESFHTLRFSEGKSNVVKFTSDTSED